MRSFQKLESGGNVREEMSEPFGDKRLEVDWCLGLLAIEDRRIKLKEAVPVGAKQVAVKRLRVGGMEWSGSLGLSLHLWDGCRSAGGIKLVGPACQSICVPCREEEMLLEHVCFCALSLMKQTSGENLSYMSWVGPASASDDEGLSRHDPVLRTLVRSRCYDILQYCPSSPELLKFFNGLYLKYIIWSVRNLRNIQVQPSSFYKWENWEWNGLIKYLG